jgi:hypothetical protein
MSNTQAIHLFMIKTKHTLLIVGLTVIATAVYGNPKAATPNPRTALETIVLIRHGEKPATDLGQLKCQGLNRALALPGVLVSKYGKADFIFAPGTHKKITKNGVQYSYVRPLMTIEPTAIRLGLPIETRFGFNQIKGLQSELTKPAYQRSLVFVAWEHHELEALVKNMLKKFQADPNLVPEWPKDDFDSIYLIKIQTQNGRRAISFRHDHEGLNGLSSRCPGPAGK